MAKDKPAPEKPALRQPIDWEAVCRDFRAGMLSVREVGTLYHVSHVSIIRKARKEGWTRDLTKRVREAVTRKVTTDAATVGSEDKIIEEAADRALAVIRKHRTSISSLAETETKLLKELHTAPKKLWIGQYQGRIIQKVVAIAVTERSAALLSLAGVLERRIKLERQAFGISDGPSGDDDIKEIPIIFDSAGEKQ